MNVYDKLLQFLPQVDAPAQKKIDLGTKLKWTLVVLALYFLLKHIPLFGLGASALSQFAQLSILLGADFGSLISLGIGPIVTAGIILQLLNGSGVLKFDTTTHQGKARFQGTTKLLSFVFVILQACIFVFAGGLSPSEVYLGTSTYKMLEFVLIGQIILGGFLIMLLDDLVAKWGLTSGISLFIAAAVSEGLFIRTFSWFSATIGGEPVGAIPAILHALSTGNPGGLWLPVFAIISTILIFLVVVFFQSMKVEIPLSFGRVRGFGIRWPLNFLYTSVIPVTLIAALLANLQLGAVLSEKWMGAPITFFDKDLAYWFQQPGLVADIITQGGFDIGWQPYIRAIWYILILTLGSLMFAWFWMQTSGMDPKSVAKQIMSSGLQIPGFRNDPRIIEHILTRYIGPLTIMGGITIGLLSALADVLGSLTTGTGLLLAVMIVYRIYDDTIRQHVGELNPGMRGLVGGKK